MRSISQRCAALNEKHSYDITMKISPNILCFMKLGVYPCSVCLCREKNFILKHTQRISELENMLKLSYSTKDKLSITAKQLKKKNEPDWRTERRADKNDKNQANNYKNRMAYIQKSGNIICEITWQFFYICFKVYYKNIFCKSQCRQNEKKGCTREWASDWANDQQVHRGTTIQERKTGSEGYLYFRKCTPWKKNRTIPQNSYRIFLTRCELHLFILKTK